MHNGLDPTLEFSPAGIGMRTGGICEVGPPSEEAADRRANDKLHSALLDLCLDHVAKADHSEATFRPSARAQFENML